MNYWLLNDARIKLGWSMEKTAEESGVPFQTTKNVLTGLSKNSRGDTVKRLSDALGVPIELLFADEGTLQTEEKVINDMKNTNESSSLKELYELQVATLKESHSEHICNIKEYYENYVREIKEHYEKRLSDKNEHIDTIMLDKKWFRLASVCSVAAIVILFLFIEFLSPGHGWFKIENSNTMLPYAIGLISVVELIIIFVILLKKQKNK